MTERTAIDIHIPDPELAELANVLGKELDHTLTSIEKLEMSIYKELAFLIYQDCQDLTSKEIKLELIKATKFSLIAAETFKSIRADLGY
ncbi:MAG: hypothetical protein WBA93_28995 [Microcoleaceae cyanobacterium]